MLRAGDLLIRHDEFRKIREGNRTTFPSKYIYAESGLLVAYFHDDFSFEFWGPNFTLGEETSKQYRLATEEEKAEIFVQLAKVSLVPIEEEVDG